MLLHFEQGLNSPITTAAVAEAPAAQDSATTSKPENNSLVTMTSLSNSVVLLSTVRAEVLDIHGNAFPVRILLDSASQANFITESCLRRGGFSRTKHRALVLAVNESKTATTRGLTSFVIRARNRDNII